MANPIAKRTREMLRIETGSITLLLSCVSVVSPLTTFHPKTHPSDSFVVRPQVATRTDQCSGELGRQHVSEGD